MRFAIAVVCAASLVSAFTVPKRNNNGQEVPACAANCAQKLGAPDPCASDDVPCICLNIDYSKKIAQCVVEDCSDDDIEKATAVGKAICKKAGIDLDNPVPACAVKCEQQAPTGDCNVDDGKCLCESVEFIRSIVKCTEDSCSKEDTKTAAFVGEALCRAYGVEISSTLGY